MGKKKPKIYTGPSAVAVASFDRPGGTHDRRPPVKSSQRRKAIQESIKENK